MNLGARLDKLERGQQDAGACPDCGASDAQPRCIVRYPSDPEPDGAPCRRCRREPVIISVVYTRRRRAAGQPEFA